MSMITVRKLPEEVHRALRARAALHGKSVEAEVRSILANAVASEGRIKLGSVLAKIGEQLNMSDEDMEIFEQVRSKTPSKPVDLG